MNPFSSLDVSYDEDESTNNPERKLAKMKRRYEKNPTPELKKRIDEMDDRLNSKPKPKKKKKKKVEEIDPEEEYLKNRKYWEEYYKNSEKREEEEKLKKEEEKRRRKQKRNRKNNKKQHTFEDYEEDEEERDRERERESADASFYVTYQEKKLLPQDIQDFISNPPDKKIYNKLCKIYHPDKGGLRELFQIINNHMN